MADRIPIPMGIPWDPWIPVFPIPMHISALESGQRLWTHTHTQPFYGSLDFVRDNSDELVPEETFTHSHLMWSSVIPYLLPPSVTIHGILSVYLPDSVFPQSLFKFSLVYLLAWHPQLHTPYVSSSNHCLLFAAHAQTIATCFAVVPRLCHLILVSLSIIYLELYFVA